MVLRRVVIKAFKSIRETCKLTVDAKVTTLLGANDHGKSNLLHAIAHLNPDNPFVADDLNWDTTENVDRLPSVTAEFSLDDQEMAQIATLAPVTGETQTEQKTAEQNQDLSALQTRDVRVSREGIPGELFINGLKLESLPDSVRTWFKDKIPRFELIEALSGNIQDEVDAETIQKDESEFIQGIFFHAGLKKEQWSPLFSHTDISTRRLDKASEVLNAHLQKMWSQGRLLKFILQNKGDKIELKVDDPAVAIRRVPLSTKSTGITHFFRLSMMLEARQMKHQANAYIFLFDEPSLHLHPLGERDLLRAFEALAEHYQFIIVTHSLFMLDLNFPERHRLVFLSEKGTSIDEKPYKSSWKRATDAYGIRVGSLALFSNKTLLVEGESDPMYLYELIRQLNALGKVDADINQLGIISYSSQPTLRYLIQLLSADESEEQKVAVLLDGDNSGDTTARQIAELCKAHNVEIQQLDKGFSTENLCLYHGRFCFAAVETIRKACEAENRVVPEKLEEKVLRALNEYRKDGRVPGKAPESPITLGKAFEILSKNILTESQAETSSTAKAEGQEKAPEVTDAALAENTRKKERGASKVALARRYVEATRDMLGPSHEEEREGPNDQTLRSATEAVRKIIQTLELAPLKAETGVIIPRTP